MFYSHWQKKSVGCKQVINKCIIKMHTRQTQKSAVKTVCNTLVSFSRARCLSLIVCLCLASCRLLKLMVAGNKGGVWQNTNQQLLVVTSILAYEINRVTVVTCHTQDHSCMAQHGLAYITDHVLAFHSNYGNILVENHEIFIPHLYRPCSGSPRWNFVKIFDANKTRMIGLPYGEKTLTIC